MTNDSFMLTKVTLTENMIWRAPNGRASSRPPDHLVSKPRSFLASAEVSAALFLFLLAQTGFAQSATIATYAGPPPPVNGAQAATQGIGQCASVTPDGAGGFYVSSVEHD